MNRWSRVFLELRRWLRNHWRDRRLSARRRRLNLPSPFLFCFSSQTDRARCFSRSQLRTNEARTHCGDLLNSIDSSSTYFFRYLIHSTATYFVISSLGSIIGIFWTVIFHFSCRYFIRFVIGKKPFHLATLEFWLIISRVMGGVVCISTSTDGCNSGKVRKKKLTVPRDCRMCTDRVGAPTLS